MTYKRDSSKPHRIIPIMALRLLETILSELTRENNGNID